MSLDPPFRSQSEAVGIFANLASRAFPQEPLQGFLACSSGKLGNAWGAVKAVKDLRVSERAEGSLGLRCSELGREGLLKGSEGPEEGEEGLDRP